MKMIIAIVRDSDYDDILHALLDAGYRVTRIASTGGFLRRGNATLLLGVPEEQVEKAVHIIQEHSAPAIDPAVKRVTVFVLNVEKFDQV
jgi:uncharacterized protein YaaQ